MFPSTKTLIVESGQVFVREYLHLPESMKEAIDNALKGCGIRPALQEGTLVVPQFVMNGAERRNVAHMLGTIIQPVSRKVAAVLAKDGKCLRAYPVRLNFSEIASRASAFADAVEAHREKVTDVLLRYETFEVATDEIDRSLDLLRNLWENAAYFQRRVGPSAAFLPRNQPLYALTCFGIVPSLMASEAHVRPPFAMGHFFFDLLEALGVCRHFPNIHFSQQGHKEFVEERAQVRIDPRTGRRMPLTDAVIFTGTAVNANKVRRAFDRNVLFIANGPGHNPVVITDTADVDLAVASALRVQLYNQGQDCANSNAFLVHAQQYGEFVTKLRQALKKVKIGPYADRQSRVGPITKREDLERIQATLVENADWLDAATEGVIRTRSRLVEPTIILKPLKHGSQYIDYFAPIFVVQRYEADDELGCYFEDARYATNAMYVTVFGHSRYVDGLIDRVFPGGRMLHDATTMIRNTDLHAPGVERGTKPYGGYGRGASSISLHGVTTSKPTLPQRDIFEQLVAPAIQAEEKKSYPAKVLRESKEQSQW